MSEQTKNLLGGNYNPDVLECLANLSNDEVFTPPKVVNNMLDMLPEETWSNPNLKFLDPACKTGVFLREIAKRLIVGLADQIPDLQERLDHIFKEQLYGIAITELTALASRRSLYCSKYANGKYAVSKFDNPDGNIRFVPINHTWVGGRCKYCGASKEQYQRDGGLETHAYEFIHTNNPEEIFNMKFDVIIGNPPYQLNVGIEKEDYAIPLYDKFVINAIRLEPDLLSFITPARWYAGGRGLDSYRDAMLKDDRIKRIDDYSNPGDCFPGVTIRGGVSFFLWDKNYHGDCIVNERNSDGIYSSAKRPMLEDGMDTFIRHNDAISILHKVRSKNERSFSELVSPQTPFGLPTSYKGNERKSSEDDLKLYISGNKAQYKGKVFFVPNREVSKGRKYIGKHKVYIAKAGIGSDTFPHQIIGRPFYGEPDSVCNQTYLVVGPFSDKVICENVMSYMRTKFFRFMVLIKKNSQDAMRGVYQCVPIKDFSKSWTDQELYEEYSLSDDEIAFIESMIKPMEDK